MHKNSNSTKRKKAAMPKTSHGPVEYDILEVPPNGRKAGHKWSMVCVVDVVIGLGRPNHRKTTVIWADTYPRPVNVGSVEEAIQQVLENFRGTHLTLATGDSVVVSYALQVMSFLGDKWATAANVSHIMDQIIQRPQADPVATETS
jgi:hypothetical protein